MAGINLPVTFTGDMSSITTGLDKSFNGVANSLSSSLSKPFSGLGGKFAAQGKQLGSFLANGIKTTMTATTAATGAAVAGIMTTALTKGFSRLNAIDQAQAKLRGLGNDAESVEQIMSDALASVSGTAFGLGEAATVAAGAVAAGIAPGQALEGVLTTVANTAAAAGVSMEEMGNIFNRVAANGKASNAELQQLADRGVPIYQALADQLGVTTEEVFKLASAGKIGFAEFEAAASSAAGNVAEEMGKTFTGSFANLQASLGRIGANLLGPMFDQLPGVIQNVTASLKPLETAAKSLGENLGAAFDVLYHALTGQSEIGEFEGALRVLNDAALNVNYAFTAVSDKLSEVWASMSGGQQTATIIGGLVAGVAAFGTALGPLLGALGPLGGLIASFLPNLGQLAGLFKFMLGPLGLVIGLFTAAFATSEEFRSAVFGLLEAILPLGQVLISALGPVLAMLPGLFKMLVTAITPLLTVVVEVATQLITMLVPVISSLISSLLPPLMSLFRSVVPAIAALLPVVAELVSKLADALLPVIESLLPVVETVFGAIGAVIEGLVPIITGIVEAITAIFQGDWQGAWDAFGEIGQAAMDLLWTFIDQSLEVGKAIVQGLIDGLSGMAAAVGETIGGIAQSIIDSFKSALGIASPSKVFNNFGKDILQGLINGIKSLLSSVGAAITSVATTMTNLFTGAKDRVVGIFNTLVTTVSGAVGRLGSAVRTGIDNAMDFVRGLPGKILGALGNLGSLLYDSGKSIVQGLINGITGMVGSLTGAVGNLLGAARRLFPSSPAKEGPFSGRGWTLYSGEAIGDGLAEGMLNSISSVRDAAESMAGMAVLTIDLSAPSSRTSLTPPSAPVATSTGTTINLNEYGPRTYSAKRREAEWAGKYSTRARSFDDGALAIP